jgi:hypothetical protein
MDNVEEIIQAIRHIDVNYSVYQQYASQFFDSFDINKAYENVLMNYNK